MRLLIVVALLFAGVVAALGWYLGPDDLAACPAAPTLSSDCKAADAIVAVSGGDTSARTHEAVSLYQSGWAPKLIFSGAAQDKTGPSNAEAMRRTAIEAGVPAGDILIEEYGATTRQNAENTQRILQQNHITSVIVVTSAYHQRRAGLEFASRSSGMVAVRNHPVARDSQWSAWWWTTPIGWFLAIGELAKTAVFYLGGLL